jgi:NADPH:quinone reductase
MKRIEVSGAGGPDRTMVLTEAPEPILRAGEVLVRVAVAGVNRPDLQQRKGLYPPPPEASPIFGLDVAGVVVRVADDVSWPAPGTPVCALVNGGGYAEFCAVPAKQCMPIPQTLGFVEAASLPEVFFTAWNNVIMLGRLAEHETLLVQGGTSGVGLAAIQIAQRLRDAVVYATAGSAEKCGVCLDYGADAAIDYKTEDFFTRVRS